MGKQLAAKTVHLTFVVLSLVSVVFIACEKNTSSAEDEEKSARISGVLSLPLAAPGKTFVIAVDDNINADDGFVKITYGTCGTDTTVNYTINQVPAGTYYLYAVVWVVAPAYSTPVTGDYVGYYGTHGTIPDEPNALIPSAGTVQFDITLIVLP